MHHACGGKVQVAFGAGRSDTDMLPIIEALLPHITDIDAQDKEGNTALHFACNHNQVSVAELLIRRGANHQLTDNVSSGICMFLSIMISMI